MSAVADKCRCCDKQGLVVWPYISEPKASLDVKWGTARGFRFAEVPAWEEPYPDGEKGSLLVCPVCDSLETWPRTQKPAKKRFR